MAETQCELERELARSDRRYRSLIERTGYAVFRASADGRLVEANAALVAMLGYDSADDVHGLCLARDVYLDPGEFDHLRERGAGARRAEWVDTHWTRRDGNPVAVRLSIRPVWNDDGRVESYEGIAEDITERQHHDEILRRSERMASLGTTLAGVAHELNNPLAAIIGFAQILLKKRWPDEDRAALETINHEAVRLVAIVRDLLALARRREGERRLPTDLNDVVGYIVRTRRYALETAGIRCELRLDSTGSAVLGDRTQLEQVVLNLLNNAEQALRRTLDEPRGVDSTPGRIALCTRHEGTHVVLEVHDNGPGIPEHARARIWDPFWTTKEEGDGTGLGLAVVHAIVADHGGTIAVTSEPGAGAQFTIRLPAASVENGRALTGQAVQPLDVLVVDPGASDLGFVERFLVSRGHVVLTAPTVEIAARLAEQGEFDAVVCNAGLMLDGEPLVLLLRGSMGCARARFIIASTEPVASNRSASNPLATGTVVARPYDVEALRRLIEDG